MSIRLMERIGNLIKADAHGVVDALEERTLLLKQHVREAELDLLQKRARLEALGEEETRLEEEQRRAAEELRALDEDVKLALGGDKEELARFAIRRLLPRRRAVEGLETARAEVGEARARLAERLATQEREFEELRSRARAHLSTVAARQRSDAEDDAFGAPAVSDEEVDLELLRRRAEARGEGAGGGER